MDFRYFSHFCTSYFWRLRLCWLPHFGSRSAGTYRIISALYFSPSSDRSKVFTRLYNVLGRVCNCLSHFALFPTKLRRSRHNFWCTITKPIWCIVKPRLDLRQWMFQVTVAKLKLSGEGDKPSAANLPNSLYPTPIVLWTNKLSLFSHGGVKWEKKGVVPIAQHLSVWLRSAICIKSKNPSKAWFSCQRNAQTTEKWEPCIKSAELATNNECR